MRQSIAMRFLAIAISFASLLACGGNSIGSNPDVATPSDAATGDLVCGAFPSQTLYMDYCGMAGSDTFCFRTADPGI